MNLINVGVIIKKRYISLTVLFKYEESKYSITSAPLKFVIILHRSFKWQCVLNLLSSSINRLSNSKNNYNLCVARHRCDQTNCLESIQIGVSFQSNLTTQIFIVGMRNDTEFILRLAQFHLSYSSQRNTRHFDFCDLSFNLKVTVRLR